MTTSKTVASIATAAVGLALALSFFATTAEAATCPYTWSTNLKLGSTGTDVMKLQQLLNTSVDTQVAATGVGSAGMETSYFGGLTKAAVIKFQNKYASEVLTPLGLTSGTGFVGAATRAKASALCGSSTTTPTPTAGSGLQVTSPVQPANSIAPKNASRIPFTKVTLTAGMDGAVTVNGIVVQRTGFGANSDFQGVILLDEMGNQMGTEKTFNSNYQATIGGTFQIPAGSSRTYTVAGNIAAAPGAGNVPSITVLSVNTTATVTGGLPIVGAAHTINGVLTIGSVSFSTSNALSTNATTTKQLGTTNYPFAGYRLTCGSTEDCRITNIRWNQTGSVSASDLANVVTIVGGTSYPTVLSSDGKYYDTTLGSGILVAKGNQIEVAVKADVVGSNVNTRTVKFNVDKNTDIVAKGELYGYSMSPTVGGSPFFFAATVTLEGASVTAINKENTVAAQNIAVNVPSQPLGGFYTDIVGEGITVQSLAFSVASSSGSGTGLLTNVTLVDNLGNVVAGPVDGVYTGATTQSITFTDSVTFKPGKTIYTLKGKVASGIGNGTQYVVSTTPNSNFTNAKGDITGNTITLPSNAISMNTMTVKAATLAATVAATPVAQNIVAGAQDVIFTTFQFDASNSGEDVRLSSIGASFSSTTALTSCRIFDGSTNLTTGSNSINTVNAATGTFLIDNPITITKGTVKSLNVVCNVLSGISGTVNVGLQLPSTGVSATGIGSGNTVSVSGSATSGQTMTIASGSMVISLDSSSPSLTLAASQTANATLGVFKLRATNESVILNKIGLALASGTTNDVSGVTLWINGVQVGSATFTSTYQAVSLSSPVTLTKDVDVLLTVKGNVPAIGTSQPGTAGTQVSIAWASATSLNQFTGSGSGTDITATGAATSTGVRIFRSIPTVARIALPSTNNLVNGTTDLFRFSVTANSAGSISLKKITINSVSTGVLMSSTTLKVIAYTDSGFSSTIGGGFTNGEVFTGGSATSSAGLLFSAPVVIPAGTTYYFKVTTDVSGVDAAGDSVSTKLTGDAAPVYTTVQTFANAEADAENDFIWAGNTLGNSAVGDTDWFNGNQVVGLPASDTDASTNTRAN